MVWLQVLDALIFGDFMKVHSESYLESLKSSARVAMIVEVMPSIRSIFLSEVTYSVGKKI